MTDYWMRWFLFQSAPRVRGETIPYITEDELSRIFQSAPRVRGETIYDTDSIHKPCISIRSPRAGRNLLTLSHIMQHANELPGVRQANTLELFRGQLCCSSTVFRDRLVLINSILVLPDVGYA